MDLNLKRIDSAPRSNRELYEKQVALLKTFLEHGAISQAQYDKSYRDLTAKMDCSPKEN